jgi:hypothetical protein
MDAGRSPWRGEEGEQESLRDQMNAMDLQGSRELERLAWCVSDPDIKVLHARKVVRMSEDLLDEHDKVLELYGAKWCTLWNDRF